MNRPHYGALHSVKPIFVLHSLEHYHWIVIPCSPSLHWLCQQQPQQKNKNKKKQTKDRMDAQGNCWCCSFLLFSALNQQHMLLRGTFRLKCLPIVPLYSSAIFALFVTLTSQVFEDTEVGCIQFQIKDSLRGAICGMFYRNNGRDNSGLWKFWWGNICTAHTQTCDLFM